MGIKRKRYKLEESKKTTITTNKTKQQIRLKKFSPL